MGNFSGRISLVAIQRLVLTEAQRLDAWGPTCKQVMGRVTIDGRSLACHEKAITAFTAWEMIRATHGYPVSGTDTGIYNCRRIGNSPSRPWSAHAWALALDVNWLTNPDGSKLKTDLPPAMQKDLQELRTNSGQFVFRWGGDWDRDPTTSHSYYDAMHWEVVAHPDDLASGIAGLMLYPEDEMQQVLSQGSRGAGVAKVQAKLNRWQDDAVNIHGFNRAFPELKTDGIFGPATRNAVVHYQRAAGLQQTGELDGLTLGFLLDTGNAP